MAEILRNNEEIISVMKNNTDLIIAGFLAIAATLLFSRVWTVVSGKRIDIPGRLGLPLIGETFAFLSATNSFKGCYEFVNLRRSWYGKWFKTRLFGKTHVFVPTSEGARKIFTSDFSCFNKGYVKSMADCVGSKSLLCVPHDSHKRIRRLLSDPFSMPSLSTFVNKFDQMLCLKLKRVERVGESFNVLDFSMHMTFDAMCSMLMSVVEESVLREIEKDCIAVSEAMLSLPLMIPGTRYYKGIKARERLMGRFAGMIARRRNGVECHEDFLQSMLAKDSYPSSEKLEDSEIMDNLLTLIIAGQTTTAAAMMWSVKFLDENRGAQDRLREEQVAIAKGKPEDYVLTLADINSMSYGLKVVKETLRMSNVLLWFPRVALSDCTVDGNCSSIFSGVEIKKGWHVNIDATCIHHDPELYSDPLQFNPSRFEEMQKSYSFIPFGSGPRTCLGMNMAKVTLLVFLHRLAGGYKWTVDDLDLSLEKKSHIPRLRSGCPITLKAI
ncbi:Ent-kaurenoic acid oxidase 2 [Linum perenne]